MATDSTPARRNTVATRPIVVDGRALHSSLDPAPPAGSPLRDLGSPWAWTPAPHQQIAASVRRHTRPAWWRRVLAGRWAP